MKIFCFEIKYIGFNPIERQVLRAWKSGNKIIAIKKYKQLTGSDLRTSKEYCDELEERFNLSYEGGSTGKR